MIILEWRKKLKIGNCNLPDKANVLGTEYKIYYETKEEIENDIEDYQEYMRYEEEVLAEEMEKQRIANYDFERGDVKY